MGDQNRGRVLVDPYYFQVDRPFYDHVIRDFLPDRIIDIHSHVTGPDEIIEGAPPPEFWAERVCPEGMNLPSLLESYLIMFPGKDVKPVIFPMPSARFNPDRGNEYASRESARFGLYALLLSDPSLSAEELERKVEDGGFVGLKPYPSMAEKPPDRVEIYDYLPETHLELADERGWIVILHIPRPGRLTDPVNLRELMEIDERYPRAHVVVAHVGRAYCPRYAEGLSDLEATENLLFDISANSNQTVFEHLIDHIGPRRIVFGSDMPISAMHARRICEGDNYVNMLLDADWEDSHTRRASPEAGVVFFLYEEIAAFRRAAEARGLGTGDVRKIFYGNAAALLGDEGA